MNGKTNERMNEQLVAARLFWADTRAGYQLWCRDTDTTTWALRKAKALALEAPSS